MTSKYSLLSAYPALPPSIATDIAWAVNPLWENDPRTQPALWDSGRVRLSPWTSLGVSGTPDIHPASQLSWSSSDSGILAKGLVQVIFLWVCDCTPSGHRYVLLLNPSIYYVIMLLCVSLCWGKRPRSLFEVTKVGWFQGGSGTVPFTLSTIAQWGALFSFEGTRRSQECPWTQPCQAIKSCLHEPHIFVL